jgi:hypothetical protein
MKELKLKEEFQFGPHTLQVVAVNGKSATDPERLVTAQCKPTCCSIEHAVTISMPAGELESLTDEYNRKFATIKMRAEISRILKELQERSKDKPMEEISLEEQNQSPFSIFDDDIEDLLD